MSNESNEKESFVIPQRKAAKHFKEVTSRGSIKGISLETTSGDQLMALPMQVNIQKVVPKVFQLPMQAIITATSILARIFRVKIIFGLEDDEP